jgi:N-methylhydantoinase A
MLSSGGVADAGAAARHGSWTVLSGPAGGAVGAARAANRAGAEGAVCLDMGGTSCDVSVARGGVVAGGAGREVGGRVFALPMVDVHTVGAGGGSIGWRDPGGALRVGPRSAGAEPGPACYGRGGRVPTVTDANLVLGRLGSDSPLAGGVELDAGAARQAVAELAGELGLTVVETALGMVRVAAEEMAQAVRVMTVERGVDPRDLSLVAFGGAGPLHGAEIAGVLEMSRVIVPGASGVLSALGLVISERRRDLARSALLRGSELTSAAVGEVVDELAAAGRAELGAESAEVRCSYDLRYRGQAFELSVDGGPEPDPAALRRDFERLHEDQYGYCDPGAELELVTVRVAVAEPGAPEPEIPAEPAVQEGSRAVLFEGGEMDAVVLRGVPERVAGPAVCNLAESTVVVPPGWSGRRVGGGALMLERDPS